MPKSQYAVLSVDGSLPNDLDAQLSAAIAPRPMTPISAGTYALGLKTADDIGAVYTAVAAITQPAGLHFTLLSKPRRYRYWCDPAPGYNQHLATTIIYGEW